MAEITVCRTAPDSFYVTTGSGSELHDLRWLQDHVQPYEDGMGFCPTLGFVCPSTMILLARTPLETGNDSPSEIVLFLDYRLVASVAARMLTPSWHLFPSDSLVFLNCHGLASSRHGSRPHCCAFSARRRRD